MIRSRRFKYCVYDSADKEETLVDMENDPGEMKNVADDPQFRDTLAAHRKFLRQWTRISDDKVGLKFVRDADAP